MGLLDELNPSKLQARAASWMQILKNLPFDGGADVTRWVFVRVAEAIALVLLILVVGGVVRYWRYGTADAIYFGAVTFIATSLIGFAQWAQRNKQELDSKTPGAASVITSGPLSTTMVDGGDASKLP